MPSVSKSRMAPEVRVAQRADSDRVLALLTVAFAADPIVRWMLPEARQHVCQFPRMADLYVDLAIARGTAYCVGQFGGTAVWLPPGVQPSEESLGALMQDAVSPDIFPEVVELFEQLEAHHPKAPCWYLPFIGVDPAYQGQGLGALLIAHTLAACDRDHLPAYLEATSPHNIRLYERHGFEAQAALQVGSSPPIVPMLRAAT